MSSKLVDQLTREQRRQQEREERRRKREQSRESASSNTSVTDAKRVDKRPSWNGSAKTNAPSKRAVVPTYKKVNVIEKTAKFDEAADVRSVKPKSESRASKLDASRRRGGSNFKDHLSKFESQAKPLEQGKKTPFARSQTRPAPFSKIDDSTSANDSAFHRSYRTNRQTAAAEDARHRRSLKSEKIADRIARLQRQSSSEEGASNRNVTSPRSEGSSATSSQTSLSDPKAATVKTLSRTQQALEKHKMRIRSSSQNERSSGKPSSPVTKTSRKSESKSKLTGEIASEDAKGEKTRRISIGTVPLDREVVEVTTVTEVMSPIDGKMNIVIKEVAVDGEDAEKLLSPINGKEYEPGDPRPISVEQAVAAFTERAGGYQAVESSSKKKEAAAAYPQRTVDLNPLTCERDVVVMETTVVTEDNTEPLHNTNQNSNQRYRDCNVDETAKPVQDEVSANVSSAKPQRQQQTLNPEEAIMILKRLSDEVQSGKDGDGAETTQVTDVQEGENIVSETDKRPTTLQIEEVLYVTEDRPKSPSPPPSETKSPPSHSFAAALEVFSRASTSSSGASSPIKSWGKYSVELSSISSESLSPTRSQALELSSSDTLSSGSSSPAKATETLSLSIAASSGQVSPIKIQKSKSEYSSLESRGQCSPDTARVTAKEVFCSTQPQDSETSASPPSCPVDSPVSYPKPLVKSPTVHDESSVTLLPESVSSIKYPTSLASYQESFIKNNTSPHKSADNLALSVELSLACQSEVTPVEDSNSALDTSSLDISVSHVKELFETTKAQSDGQLTRVKLSEYSRTPSDTSPNSQSPGKDISNQNSTFTENLALESVRERPAHYSDANNKHSSLDLLQSALALSCGLPTSIDTAEANLESDFKSSAPSSSQPSESSPLISENINPFRKHSDPVILSTTQPIQDQKKSNVDDEMLATRSAPRYKKSWLDESDDDDNTSVLSDAASDASSIDMDWLGPDSDDEYSRKKSTEVNSSSVTVQRSSSSAQDMLRMWEKKVHKPEEVKKNVPEKLLGDSLKRVGSVREGWQTGNRETSGESKQNGRSKEMSPRKSPKREKSVRSSPLPDASFQSTSSIESQEEMTDRQEIFEELKATGKIDGAKAMFESLSQSPRKSPLRSPQKRAEPRRDQSEAKDISSVSQESNSSLISDGQDESPLVDNMRAMFERQNNQKAKTKKQKTSENEDNRAQKRLSSVQRRVAGRRQEKRSMTQPVTSDDVMKAQDIMKDSLKANSDTDEEELNFVDRLKFFNQLAKSSPRKTKVRRRSDTQPVKSTQIAEAARQFEEKQYQIQVGVTESWGDRPPPISLVDVSASEPAIISPSIEKLTKKFSTSGSEDDDSVRTSSSPIDEPGPGRKKLLLSSQEDENDMSARVAEIKTTGSIHDRMKRLQKKQTEERWKRSSKNSEVKSSVSERLNLLKGQEDRWKKSSNSEFTSRVEKLSDRIAKMKEDAVTWKGRTGQQNDAAQFTVQAKLAKRDGKKLVAVLPSPTVKRRVLPEGVPTHNHVSEKDVKKSHDSASMNQLSFVEKLSRKGLEENVIKTTEVHTTEVPTIDNEEFDKFFVSSEPVDLAIANGFHEDIENFPTDQAIPRLSDIGRLKSSVKLQAKRRSSKRNPLKVLAARTDLKLSYDSARSNVGKLEQQRIAVQRGHGANFTAAALAGLAAKADLKKVNLRSTKNTPMLSSDDLKPFNDVMLLRAKGRRRVQTRLVEPKAKSLCSDDAFLLVTPNKLFGWFGEYCNVIERAKINEIADYIVIKGDLGCKVGSYQTIEENSSPGLHKDFWEILGGQDEWDRSTTPGSDEQYEVEVETTVKTYKMIDSKLVPHAEAWGNLPKMSMLLPADTYVFDFGAEMYIWQGKEVSFSDRRLAVRLARVLWEQDYDFTEQGISPFHGKDLKGPRPEFGLFARVNENLETSLFQEKFEDWSNIYRETGEEKAKLRESSRGKAVEEMTTKSDIAVEAKPCDVKQMIDNIASHSPTIIDGIDISCYDEELTDEDGRVLEIVTEETEQYFIGENGVEQINDSVLHRENCYVIKWKYLIKSTGRFAASEVTNSKWTPSNSGRSKVAYFSWIGMDSATGGKGASALIASNMETGDWPVITFTESTMPPVFRRCFRGNLVITNGKRGVRRGGFNWKLFRVIGNSSDSATLSEVNCECKSLRSCSSFVALQPRDALAYIWHGCRSPQRVKDAAEHTVSQLTSRMPQSIPFRRGKTSIDVTVCEEGDEPDAFWDAIGIKRRNRYECLADSSMPTVTTRGWHFNIVAGEFCAKELEPIDPDTILPLHQNQLASAEKPSVILIECTQAVFLWQNCDLESMAASAKRKWDVVRRLAIETTITFCESRFRDEATLIEAECEPNTFTNAFPSWINKETSVLGRQKTTKAKPVSEVLASLTRLIYSIEELRAKELPDGVDARYLETYLSNEDFEKLFEMSKPEYYKLPSWKQTKLRQQKNFF